MSEVDYTIVRRQIVVDAPIDRAFTVFTGRFGDFNHRNNLMASPINDPPVGLRTSWSTRWTAGPAC